MSNSLKLDNFQKIKILGQGTYGKCYIVRNIQQEQLCVLKQIQIAGRSQPQIEQTMKQAKILQALDHPNIIKCIQAFVQNKTLNILMQFADAGDLSRKIKNAKGKYFSQNQIWNWFTQICLAIKHVHDRKIIHRDLKSQNIFLTSENIVKLGDFGIAKPLKATLQKMSTVVGTPYYMSPQICQNKQYSLKTDIWSLGVILFEMCALRPPFDANSLPALALKISRGQYQNLPRHCSKELKQVVADLLIVDPIKRPTINQILKHPSIKTRICIFLSQQIREKQFSHTPLNIIFQKNNEIARIQTDVSSPKSEIFSNFFPSNVKSQSKLSIITGNKIKQLNTKQKNPFEKKKKLQSKKRQISEPSLTPRNNQRKLKSNISLTNLQRKKSDKQRQKQKYFKKKKTNQQIVNNLSQLKQIRGEVLQLHLQLSQRNQKSSQDEVGFIKNYIKQVQNQDYQISQQSSNEMSQQQHTQKHLKQNILSNTLESLLIDMIGEEKLNEHYFMTEQHYGFPDNSTQNQGLITLLYGLNTIVLH